VSNAKRRGGLRDGIFEQNLNFLKCPPSKSLEKKKALKSRTGMNIIIDDRISETHDSTNQFVLFPTPSRHESWGEQPPSRLSRERLDALVNAEPDNARSAHFFTPPPEPPEPTPEKGLAAGVLKQAARDLRRFRAATTGVKRELYLDAYSWITANDFSWPYSFVNVCKLLHVCPEVIRTELLADASLGSLDYWTRRAGRLSRRLQSSFVRVFASGGNPEDAEGSQLASCI
jgi:hypothetical protein